MMDAVDRGHARFLTRIAAGFATVLLVRALWPAPDRWAIQGTLASLVACFRAARLAPVVSGDIVTVGATSFAIVRDCTPLVPTLLLAVAMLAHPASWRHRAAGILAAAAALWAYNLARVALAVVVLGRWPRVFPFVHVYLWQSVTLVVVVALFLAWIHAVDGRRAPAT